MLLFLSLPAGVTSLRKHIVSNSKSDSTVNIFSMDSMPLSVKNVWKTVLTAFYELLPSTTLTYCSSSLPTYISTTKPDSTCISTTSSSSSSPHNGSVVNAGITDDSKSPHDVSIGLLRVILRVKLGDYHMDGADSNSGFNVQESSYQSDIEGVMKRHENRRRSEGQIFYSSSHESKKLSRSEDQPKGYSAVLRDARKKAYPTPIQPAVLNARISDVQNRRRSIAGDSRRPTPFFKACQTDTGKSDNEESATIIPHPPK